MRRAFLHGRSDRRHGSRDRSHFRHFTADLFVRSLQLPQIIVMCRLHGFADADDRVIRNVDEGIHFNQAFGIF